jgi:putative transposon-encoded protein
LNHMVRWMKATITQIKSIVTPSGNSGHVVVPKAWICKEAIIKLKEKENRSKKKNQPRGERVCRVVMGHSS